MKVFHAFSGIDSQLIAEKRVWGENVEVVGTMEIDVDAVIASALIHSNGNFHKDYNKEWDSTQYNRAKEWLSERNIGFDFDKGKSKLDRMKKEKLKQLYIASVLTHNYGILDWQIK